MTTHPCPGCERPGVPHGVLACRPCWFRLPRPIRTAIYAAYRKVRVDPKAHRAAVASAVRWYGLNPPAGPE